jgi:hypothetical protein
MRYIAAIFLIMTLTACSAILPQLTGTIEDIADDTAINCKISKEAIQMKDMDIEVSISVKRK